MTSDYIENAIDWSAVRAEFPVLARSVHGNKPLIYFDNANTTQKPLSTITATDSFYRIYNANVSRAMHALGSQATEAYEDARTTIAEFIGAQPKEIVLCSGATYAINLVAYSWALPRLKANDVILVSQMEHHANIVPWQLIAQRTGATIHSIPLASDGTLDRGALSQAIQHLPIKILAITHASNVLGTINPVQDICKEATSHGIITIVDGSQAAAHLPVDMRALGCDFYAFTGHKLCGPTGTGVLWVRKELLSQMLPFVGGGEMIKHVSFSGTEFNEPPYLFEAGTPNIAGFVGLASAIRYLSNISLQQIHQREQSLLCHLTTEIQNIQSLQILGSAPYKTAILSFIAEKTHPHDIATLLDLEGVAIRAGMHCAHPLFETLGLSGACRVSLSFYNTHAEIDRFIAILKKVLGLLQ